MREKNGSEIRLAGRGVGNRFASRKRDFSTLKDILLPVLIFAVILSFFAYGLSGVGQTTEEERMRSVEKAISKATVQCYAVEGQYPPSLAYLEDHYGLSLDYDKYIIQYDVFASNIMPTILVMPREFQDQGQEVWPE